jgi:pyruvate dehydrogenase E2 component (dihydrolipoamide acetyltransferase)
MPTNILMPALSPTIDKGNLAKRLKEEGQVIADVKVAMYR